MISFITLSRDPEKANNLKQSLHLALDSEFTWQLLIVDGACFDIFQGYNQGARQAEGEFLAFIHDDVIVLGNCLTFRKPLELLRDAATGFVGVAGTRRLGEEGCWWGPHFSECRGMAAHPSKHEMGMHWNFWPWKSPEGEACPAAHFGRVAVLDGVFLMCHRHTFDRLGGFDGAYFQGFHFYDIDITLRASLAGLNNYAMPIPIFHWSSSGPPGPEWETNRRKLVDRFRDVLPYAIK